MAKIGERGFCDDNDAFARVYNNLLLRNMNTFITLYHCTFDLLFALFSILIYQLLLHDNSA